VVLIGFTVLFFTAGPSEWNDDRTRKLISAALLLIGLVTFFITQFKSRKEKKDERTYLIELKAAKCAMTLIVIYAFIFSISLFVIYENKMLPSSWLWFLAYSTLFLSYIFNSALYLWFEKRNDGYGKY
jgi:uncharacterized membrane protein